MEEAQKKKRQSDKQNVREKKHKDTEQGVQGLVNKNTQVIQIHLEKPDIKKQNKKTHMTRK